METTTPTFTTRCTELRTHIGRIQSSDADKHLVQTMEKIREELAEYLSQIADLTKTRQVFSTVENMPKPAIDAATVKTLKKKIGTLTGKLDTSRSQIGKNNNWADCVVKAKGLGTTLEKDLKKTWTDFIEGERPGFEMFLGFRGLPQCAGPIKELERLSGVLNGLKSTLPEDSEPIELVRTTATKMRETIATLGLEGHPDEMVEFLKKCSTEGGAPFSELTPKIFQWILDEGFAGDLRVKSR